MHRRWVTPLRGDGLFRGVSILPSKGERVRLPAKSSREGGVIVVRIVSQPQWKEVTPGGRTLAHGKRFLEEGFSRLRSKGIAFRPSCHCWALKRGCPPLTLYITCPHLTVHKGCNSLRRTSHCQLCGNFFVFTNKETQVIISLLIYFSWERIRSSQS